MDREALRRRDILEKVARRELSREEAMRLLKETAPGPRPVAPVAAHGGTGSRDIAIIGMSGQFPGAPDVERFWENLLEGRDSVTSIPKDRWDGDAFYDPDPRVPGRSTCNRGGFLSDVDRFDREFFGISPREAQLMDPQQRLFLQEAWRALEDAGYSDTGLAERSCGVYVGFGWSDYRLAMAERDLVPEGYALGGISGAILAARIAYFLNLRGPALTVDTACSASLVAIHLACESLWSGTVRMALAAGVSLFMTPDVHVLASKMGMLSTDGRCKTFDDEANGFVPAEGVGVVVLKPLEDALADGDSIHAVIKATGINQDGKTNGITAPSAPSQLALETGVYTRFGIDPGTLGYVEAHGTGTKLGDPIEIQALSGAFSRFTDRKQFCAIGAVKTNIGHSIAAAGVAGVIKTALCLKHRRIPRSLHFHKPNRHIDFAQTPFYVPTETRDWPAEAGRPRRAAISSFGFSGTNAHLVLEEAPARKDGRPWPVHLALFSAKTDSGLRRVLERFLAWLPEGLSERSLEDVTYTLQVGRSHFPVRCALVARDAAELKAQLQAVLRGEAVEGAGSANLESNPVPWDAARQSRGEALLAETAALAPDAETACRNGLLALKDLYLQGYALPWETLHHGGGRRRVSLPTYPFEGERYGLPGPHPSPMTGSAAHSVSPTPGSTPGGPIASAGKPVTERSAAPVLAAKAPPAAAAPKDDSRERLRKDLARLAAEVLKLDPRELDLRKPLSVYGFDSILFTELVSTLKRVYGVELDATVFFEHPTLLSFADHLHGLLPESALRGDTLPEPQAAIAEASAEPTRDAEATDLSQVPTEAPTDEPIAIVGMAGRFPQSLEVDAFWEHLLAGDDLVTEVPAERWDWRAYFGDPAKEPGKTRVKWGGFIDDVDRFDALFFGISPKEAEVMDPQQRLFLETAWKAIEDSGHRTAELWGSRTGVFVGMAATDYPSVLARQGSPVVPQSVTGSSRSILPNRLSYLLNLRGPSEAVDTACSSALVALHRAVQALRRGECDQALVGGVHVMLDPDLFVIADKGGLLSPDGRSKTFDASANGYVRGEGVAVVVLKPLRKARKDGDTIHGLIRGVAINHGGRSTSLTAPNPVAQAEAMVEAYTEARIDPATVTYVEAMGTGTALGDPIELNALKKAFAELYRRWDHPPATQPHCGLGSVKTNIGHLEPASGMASLVKVLLSLRHGVLPATLHVRDVNPRIQLEGSPFYLNREARPWQRLSDAKGNVVPRRAGVNSFGYGGVNAHVVLEEYLPPPQREPARRSEPGVLVLSARDPERLRAYATLLRDALGSSAVPRAGASSEGLREDVAALCAELLGVDAAEVLADDSILGALLQRNVIGRLVERIEEKWDVFLLPSEFVGVEGLGALVERIARKRPQAVSVVRSEGLTPDDFASVLYTLQVGRDAHDERLALVASNASEAREGLDAYLHGQALPGRLYQGHRKRSAEALKALGAKAEAPALEGHLKHHHAAPLAEAWALGSEVDWSRWYAEAPPRRVPLPTYPFARTRYWAEAGTPHAPPAVLGTRASSAEGTRFTHKLSGDEFFVRDHVIQGQRLLPGAVSLELARAAAVELLGTATVRGLRQVSWRRPVVVDAPREVSLRFGGGEDGLDFEVTMDGEGAREHARGRLLLGTHRAPPAPIDVASVLSRCHDRKPGTTWYEALRQSGSDYGPSLRVIEELACGDHESIARLRLPDSLREHRQDFVLHPALMDGAFQSLAGLLRPGAFVYVPVTLEELELFGPLPPDCYVRAEEVAAPPADGLRTFHLQVLDLEGRHVARLRGLSVKPLERGLARPAAPFYCERRWELSHAQTPEAIPDTKGPLLVFGPDAASVDRVRTHLEALGVDGTEVLFVRPGERFERIGRDVFTVAPGREEDFDRLLDALGEGRLPGRLLHLWSEPPVGTDAEDLEQQLLLGFYSVASLCRALASRKPKQRIQLLHAHASGRDGSEPLHAAVAGLLRTARMESPALALRSVELADAERPSLTAARSLAVLLRELGSVDGQDVEIQYREGRRYVSSLGVLREKR
ncbi:hypothetical protein KH5H1_74240 [Corallococcus caeni]|uniref:beta-ketoacyl synthase N-terminal-like domain-containing protein n=1 Tax=Corallococcus caeni TaxID=3082388 RepID=UPI0029571751|nr:hypothetical protein KH5H1_74240 [Corallococcus sp. KH5-1]